MESKTETKQLITKDMLIGDIINKHPETAGIMLGYGLHCVGCSANPFDTIQSGCLSHGMDEKTIDNLVDEINKSLQSPKVKSTKTISITESAAEKLKEFMENENKQIDGLRFVVISNEDSLQYGLELAEKRNPSEDSFEDRGMKIFVERDVVNMIKGTEIDFISNEKGSGFKINNPGIADEGGCGPGCGCH